MVGGNLELKKPIIPDMFADVLLNDDGDGGEEGGGDGSCDGDRRSGLSSTSDSVVAV